MITGNSQACKYRNSRKIIFLTLVFSMLFLLGCAIEGPIAVMTSESFTQVDFEIVDTDSIADKSILEWIDENHLSQGIYTLDNSNWTQTTKYILIAEGEKPTGGYVIQVEQLQGYDEEIRVVSTLREPKKGDFVTQSFTYPYVVLKIKYDERKIVLTK